MSNKRRDHLPRLSIAPNLNMQQPMGGGAMFSPALPTSLQQSFHPAYPMVNSLQTPMQSFFNPQMPGAPGRPTHHPNHASIQLAAAGIHPPNFITPVASHFPRPSMMLAPGSQPQAPSHPFPGRNRRQLSIGGPPKAVLGGPARKLSPMPGAAPATPGANASAAGPTPEKRKKVVVNLPKETVAGEEGESSTRPSWARAPLADDFKYVDEPVIPAETSTADIYPPDAWRHELPNSIDVYLPGKLAWEEMKQRNIEEKLERLGVERGSGSNVPHIHAPHARAASISSPADPALLLFKLNKLHQSQEASSGNNSLSVSPQPPFAAPFGLSPSPGRFITNRHGHTMSLAQPPSYQSSLFSSSPSPFGTFGPNGALSSIDNEFSDLSSVQADSIHAPQGRIPMIAPDFIPAPLSAVGAPKNQMDFAIGFGLDVPLESEEEEEEADNPQQVDEVEDSEDENAGDRTEDMELDDTEERGYGGEIVELDDAATTVPASGLHSRHISKLSAALSLRSVGGNFQAQFRDEQEEKEEENEDAEPADVTQDDEEEEEEPPREVDPVEEWTGSEDIYLGAEGAETSDDESLGEWSNPSDEERARQQRNERRTRRRVAQQQIDQPRRLPNFPRPPDNTHVFHSRQEDDIISNPSEEEDLVLGRRAEFMGVATEEYYPDSSSNLGPHSHPHPHSRVASGQYFVHDPAMAHSRHASDNFGYTGSGSFHGSTPSTGRRESLNPFAKPFVFGAPRESGSVGGSGSWKPFNGESTPPMPMPNVATHSRLPSLGKPLNVAAPEFKPGSFNFRLPGAPPMPLPAPGFPEPEHIDHEDIDPPMESSPFRVQGREKRQRRDSSASLEEGDSMTSFRFPPNKESSPQAIRRHHSASLSGDHKLNPSAQPFTFAGFSAVANNMPWMPQQSGGMSMPEPDVPAAEESINDASTAKANNSEAQVEQAIVPPQTTSKPKRAPIPLDFKHPVSSNTVPAGLFKALVNSSSEERTRRAVRSRLSSREIFEHMHLPSMDDNNVALIAHNNSRNRLVTDPGNTSRDNDDDDVFSSARNHNRRRSSLPDALHESSPSEMSVAPRDLTTRMEIHHIESVISQLLDEKLAPLRSELSQREQHGEKGVSSTTESMMADVISLFRTQLHESATRSLEDSQMDARGEMDFQMIKDVIEQSHMELLSAFQREIKRVVQHALVSHLHAPEVVSAIEGTGQRTVNAVVEAISELSARQEAFAVNAPARERDLTAEKIVNVLSPLIDSLRNDPIDYEFLTRELTQAVKPHISQLIDLASDKRETAGLIVDRILPHIHSLKNMPIDTDAITLQLITEVRRAIAPIDAFEIKEQVADLVVERLDSRLAVRDKAFNVDVVTAKVTESVSRLLESLNTVPAALELLSSAQKAADEKQAGVAASQSEIAASITNLPEKVGSQLEELKVTQNGILTKLNQPVPISEPDANILLIKNLVESLASEHSKLAQQGEDALLQSKLLTDKLDTLPEAFLTIANGLQGSITELITSRDSSKRELEELRKLNTEYQVQVTKARSSHGQVRVEKDMVSEKLTVVEGDRERLRAQVKELQAAASSKTAESVTLEARNAELEDALAKALARLQSADVATQADQLSISKLEKNNVELTSENAELKEKVSALQLEITVAVRERENTSKSFESLQKQHDLLISRQGNWEMLNAATEKINMVYKLLENADDEEQQEMRHHRERSKALEGENVTLQKRLKESDMKLANADKAAATTRQTLTQAQQRSMEWERRAKDYEGQVEMLQTKLEQAEQTQSQLEADYNLAKMQVDEQEAGSRLVEDRENKLRDQIAALESKCSLLQTELEKANAAVKLAGSSPAPFKQQNGNTHPPVRPDSRASTVYNPRGDGATRRLASYSSVRSFASPQPPSQPSTSVWDSMHAPSNQNGNSKYATPASVHAPPGRYPGASYVPSTPKARHSTYNQYQRGAPSPTPSTVSAAPTQGDDGWWS